jgi:DNA-binding beta-propeller fold protein YncE
MKSTFIYMMQNFLMYGIFFISFYSILFYENIFGESNTAEYQYLTKFGGKESNSGGLSAPHSIDIDKEGNVYVTDTGNDRIQKYNLDGKFILQWGEEGSGDGQFDKLHDVHVDPSGQFIYTLELSNHRVQKFTPGQIYFKMGI